ncbi:MAG: asparagine synthase [Lachnospiraceae bacterium]|nr:asparagine synthase [Lachnospiraceae bacterium]
MRIDKAYCMSSYLAFRYVHDQETYFKEGLIHHDHPLIEDGEKAPCRTAEEIDQNIQKILGQVDLSKSALFLSGGMDSAILAAYMPAGTKAYTARCVGKNAVDETEQARRICEINHLEHVIVDVEWKDYADLMDELMLHDGSPTIPNEPQAYKMARQAKADGAVSVVYGDCADTEFGGMDRLLSKDWSYGEWVERFSFLDPKRVLKDPVDVSSVYDLYRVGEDGIDFIAFISEVYAASAAGALSNACKCAGLQCVDPYERLKMAEPLDLKRVRSGESKYLIRDLFRMKYPELKVPEKLPMSRPMEDWMKAWKGPKRAEFLPGCIEGLTGEQKFLVYSLEHFLDLMAIGDIKT